MFTKIQIKRVNLSKGRDAKLQGLKLLIGSMAASWKTLIHEAGLGLLFLLYAGKERRRKK